MCEFTAHYTCRNTEIKINLKSTTIQWIQLLNNKFVNGIMGSIDLA